MTYLPAADGYNTMQVQPVRAQRPEASGVSSGLWHNFGGVDAFENGRAMIRRASTSASPFRPPQQTTAPPPGSAEENFGRIFRADLAAYATS